MGEEQPAEKGEDGTSKAELAALWRGTADTSKVNAQMDYAIHLKVFMRRRQETLVSRMKSLEQFCPVRLFSQESRCKIADFYKAPHIYASYLTLPLGPHAVQVLFPAMKLLSTWEPDSGPMHWNPLIPSPQGLSSGAQRGCKPSSFRMPPTFPLLFLSRWLFSPVPLLQGWDDIKADYILCTF